MPYHIFTCRLNKIQYLLYSNDFFRPEQSAAENKLMNFQAWNEIRKQPQPKELQRIRNILDGYQNIERQLALNGLLDFRKPSISSICQSFKCIFLAVFCFGFLWIIIQFYNAHIFNVHNLKIR